jgi:hypothetical protein
MVIPYIAGTDMLQRGKSIGKGTLNLRGSNFRPEDRMITVLAYTKPTRSLPSNTAFNHNNGFYNIEIIYKHFYFSSITVCDDFQNDELIINSFTLFLYFNNCSYTDLRRRLHGLEQRVSDPI